MADTLDKIEEGILNVYNENLAENADFEVVKAMVNAETWLTGDEASKYFNINVSESVDAVACTSDYFNKYNKVPKNLSNKFKKEEMPKNNIEDNTLEKEMLLMELELI